MIDMFLETLETGAGGRKKVLTYLFQGAMVFLVFPFAVCSCFVAEIPTEGAVAVLTAAFFSIDTAGGIVFTRTVFFSAGSIAYGVLVGMSCSTAVISLMTAVFWSQLSGCEPLNYAVAQVSRAEPCAVSCRAVLCCGAPPSAYPACNH